MNIATRCLSRQSWKASTITSLLLVTALTGCAESSVETIPNATTAISEKSPISEQEAPRPEPTQLPPSPKLHAQLPGIGTAMSADIPQNAQQVVLVTGEGRNSSKSRADLYQKDGGAWTKEASWPAHNALKGWTHDHYAGDLRSPVGVFTLTDTGGRLPDPGSKLPYDRSSAFVAPGTGFNGEPLAGSFDYVVAINYNRKPGTSPLDFTRPLGNAKGGGIWLHVDHGSPTHGCVSLKMPHMKQLLLALDPARHPVVVMGDAKSLRQ
ncbi:L,D-transpeptidase family protein [Streptomyces sp. NPDC026665]|uniref:L,D-transpeptidase family protein n=1 Tax=Streptomyces sp. NPDC026665 TaxID=3154798 RepID=UPI0033C238D6